MEDRDRGPSGSHQQRHSGACLTKEDMIGLKGVKVLQGEYDDHRHGNHHGKTNIAHCLSPSGLNVTVEGGSG